MIALRLATDDRYTPRHHRPFCASPSTTALCLAISSRIFIAVPHLSRFPPPTLPYLAQPSSCAFSLVRDRGLFPSGTTSELTTRSLRLSSLQWYDSSFTVRVLNIEYRCGVLYWPIMSHLECLSTASPFLHSFSLAAQDIAYNMLWFRLPHIRVDNERRPNFIFVCTQQVIRFTPANSSGYSICSAICMLASPWSPLTF